MKRHALESNLVSILGPTTHLFCDPEQVLSRLGASVSSFVKWDICPSQGCWEILYVKSLTQGLVLSSPSPEGATTHKVFVISRSCCGGHLIQQRAWGQLDKGLGLCSQTELSLSPATPWDLGLLRSCCTSSMENSAWHTACVQ